MRAFASSMSFGLATLLSLGLLSAPSRADDISIAAPVSEAPPTSADARWSVYVAGYAWHNRQSYSDKQLSKMNEKTWGGGVGRSTRDERGNESTWYAVGIRDSNRRPQWMAGYSYQWMFASKPDAGVEVGAGLTALVIRRHDWFHGRPFPAVLPVVSLGTHAAKLIATYVPHLSAPKKKGDVVEVMIKFTL
jgi:palmitoyl transferase